MSPARTARTGACLTLLLAASSCTTGPQPAHAPVSAGELLAWIERVYVEAELARDKLVDANKKLQQVVAGGYEGDPLAHYRDTVATIQQSTDQAAALQATIAPLRRAAQPFFAGWVMDLNSFTDSTLWQRSQVRLVATRRRYDQLMEKLEALGVDHSKLNRQLHDAALFLRHDFNTSATAEIRDEAKAVDAAARKLDVDYGNYLLAARSYLTAAAPPPGTEAAAIDAAAKKADKAGPEGPKEKGTGKD